MVTNFKLFEGKKLGKLYHIFDLEKCDYILSTNSLSSYKFSNISTTRNKNMSYYIGDSPVSIFKLELDGDKLSDKFKINPITYPSNEVGYGSIKKIRLQEFEEQIKTNKIPNIRKYTNKFIINKERVEHLKHCGWFDSDGGHFNHSRINLPSFFKEYIPKIKEIFGEIYVQDGIKIEKNDAWIDSIINYKIKIINHGYCLYWRGYKKSNNIKNIGLVDNIIPLDNRNGEIEKLVIGYDYDNLYLSKNNNFINLPAARDDYDLYIFDFEYENEDILYEDNGNVHIKSGYLSNVDILIKKKSFM